MVVPTQSWGDTAGLTTFKAKKHWKLGDVSRHILTIYEDRLNVDIICIAPTRQNLDIYRVKYLDSGVVVNMNIKTLHKAGNMFVKTGPVVLKDYLLN